MPTIAEVLKAAGMDDAAIAALDAKAVAGFTQVLSSAESERSEAEKAQRAATALYEQQITPALNDWANKEANITAERDYYKSLADKAKDGGFIPQAPPFTAQPRNGNGQYVANANPVPGSPDLKQVQTQLVSGLGALTDLQWKYQSLFGKPMPDAPTALLSEAENNRMPFPEWAAKKYGFAEKETALRADEQKKHDDAIRAEVTAQKDREFAEKYGSNPNIRQAATSQFAELKKAVKEGTRPDPLKMSPEQRRAATSAGIRQDIAATIQ